jgi:hypothetical protein
MTSTSFLGIYCLPERIGAEAAVPARLLREEILPALRGTPGG